MFAFAKAELLKRKVMTELKGMFFLFVQVQCPGVFYSMAGLQTSEVSHFCPLHGVAVHNSDKSHICFRFQAILRMCVGLRMSEQNKNCFNINS